MKELVNTLNPTVFKETKINLMVQNNSNINMNINILREWSASSSTNSSRVLLVHLDLFSILYHKRMEVLNNKLSWNKQVDLDVRENFSLLYTIPKVRENKLANETIVHIHKDRE